MPELPEVETIRRVIEPQLWGLAIRELILHRPEVIAHPEPEEFCRRLMGQTFCSLKRRGKFLILELFGGDRVIVHLRMTGCLLVTPENYPQEKHTHVVFRLEKGLELRFSDTRRFGRLWLLKKGEADTYSGIEKLGMEPLDTALTGQYLQNHWGKRKKAIKDCLLEQNVLAGIGNIYSDEILFQARIRPDRPACSLTGEEWDSLARIIPQCLSFFIRKNQLSPKEYLESKGQDYRNTPYLQVYGRQGLPCPSCGTSLCRTVIGGRSSVYCPCCQKLV